MRNPKKIKWTRIGSCSFRTDAQLRRDSRARSMDRWKDVTKFPLKTSKDVTERSSEGVPAEGRGDKGRLQD
jgi:hypothetical protein